MTKTDSPNEFSDKFKAFKQGQKGKHCSIWGSRDVEDAFYAGIEIGKAMGVHNLLEVVRPSPAHDELIAELEAQKASTMKYGACGKHEFASGIDYAVSLLRAHKPAPVDLEKIAAIIDNAYNDEDLWEEWNGESPTHSDYALKAFKNAAKAVIQALGMTV